MAFPNKDLTRSPMPTDAEVRHPLQRLRGTIRRYVAIEGVLAVLIFAGAFFWLDLALDYGPFAAFAFDWVQEVPRWLRIVVLVSAALGITTVVVRQVVFRLFRDFSPDSLALVLEKKFPKQLGGRLITAIQMADVQTQAKYGYSEAMIQKTISEARERVVDLPVSEVFDWKRLRRFAVLLVLLIPGVFLLAGGVIAGVRGYSPATYAGKFDETTTIWAERNILLMNTPWPRSAYLEVVDFPDAKTRIGRDRSSPRVRVQAYRWVWADSQTSEGWRPLTWADLPTALPNEAIPELPYALLAAAPVEGIVASGLSGVGTIEIPQDLVGLPATPAAWKIDRVEALLAANADESSALRKRLGNDAYEALVGIVGKLEARAGESSMSRTLRSLKIPDDVSLSYRGRKTRVEMPMRNEGSNEFVGIMSDLKENVTFRARGDDYTTPDKQIELVPAPAIAELKRTEYRPAYLYHRPLLDDSATADELRSSAKPLKGLRQVVADLGISLSGERSRFDIPAGTEFTLNATVDKPLKAAEIQAKPGKFPGATAGEELRRIPLKLSDDRKTASYDFTAANDLLLTRTVDFDLWFQDEDNVTSKRAMQVVPEADQPPEVEVLVDVLRRSGTGNVYLCTPKALIPFSKESKIRDRQGIDRVEFVGTLLPQDTSSEVGIRAGAASLLWIGTPVFASLGDFAWKASVLNIYGDGIRSAQRSLDLDPRLLKSFVSTFGDRDRGELLTLAALRPKLLEKPDSVDRSPIVRTFDFRVVNEEGFDLRTNVFYKGQPYRLERQSEEEIQKQFVLTLNVRATDTNVETGPGIGENKEPFTFKIVSEEELLSEIAREQSDLALKIEEALKRLRDGDRKIDELTVEVPSQDAMKDFTGGMTKAQTVGEQLAKAKELVAEVSTDYSRIAREYYYNRFAETRQNDLRGRIVTPLEQILAREFPDSEEAHKPVIDALTANRNPGAEPMRTDRAKIQVLIARLETIRAEMGVVLGINNLVDKLRRIKEENDKRIRDGLKVLLERKTREIFAPVVAFKGSVELARGASKKIALDLQWRDEQKEPHFLFATSNEPTLKVTASVEIKDAAERAELEIAAGMKAGEYEIRIEQSVGKPLTIRVVVK